MNMKNIEEFLAKFKLIEDPKKNKVKISKVLFDVLGVNVPEMDIFIKNSQIIIKTNPAIKSFLFTKKENTLFLLEKELMKKNLKIVFK